MIMRGIDVTSYSCLTNVLSNLAVDVDIVIKVAIKKVLSQSYK